MPKGRRNTISSRNSSSARTSSGSGAVMPGISMGGGAVASGGSQGGNATTSEDLTAEAINDRLQQYGNVHVRVNSRSRGGNEDVRVQFLDEPGIAEVSSELGGTYNVDYVNGSCNCMHYRMREERCRHLDAVDIAIGEVSQSISGNSGINAIRRLDQIEEDARNNIERDQEDDEFFYLDHMSTFRRKLREGIDVEYEYENVLNGNDLTFGIELEFVGGNPDAIARELYREGICAYPERVRYHAPSVEGKWKLERDGSVSDGSGGGELVSPILKDNPETWRQIERICEIANRYGARIDQRCGGHVHIGMEPLDTARQRWRRFFKIMSGYEECVYRAAGGDLGRMRSNSDNDYARRFRERAEFGINHRVSLNNEYDVRNLTRAVSGHNRYYGVNLTNISDNRRDTVEFRYFNGSLNPKQIQANVKLSAGIMTAARKCRTKDINSIDYQVSESFKRRGKIINEYNSTSPRTQNKLAEFLDIVFTRKKDKDALISVLAKNTWK